MIMSKFYSLKVILTGGGTLGSVEPLLAVIPQLQKKHQIFFVGTNFGPEAELIHQFKIPFASIIAPKFRRYFSLWHILIPFEMIIGLFQATRIILRIKPDVIVSAGGFVGVPLIWMGWVFRVKSIIHQQDIKPGLANILTHLFANLITVNFKESRRFFSKNKTQCIGNPARDLTVQTNELQLDKNFPTVLIMGGGTGAQAINDLVNPTLCEFANVIHITGKGKTAYNINHPRYFKFELLTITLNEALNKADLVVARAGLGTITELAALAKPAIIIPLPNSHQKDNARLLNQRQAAVVVEQEALNSDKFIKLVRELLTNHQKKEELSKNIHTLYNPEATVTFVRLIQQAGRLK